MKPKVKYKFKGHKLPMELMVWDENMEPGLQIVCAIFPNREYPFLTCGPDGENGFGYEHAALPEGVEPKPKKKKRKKDRDKMAIGGPIIRDGPIEFDNDLIGKVLVDKDSDRRFMVVGEDEDGALYTLYHGGRQKWWFYERGFKFEDGTPLGGESDE